jgi:hypothetical protein
MLSVCLSGLTVKKILKNQILLKWPKFANKKTHLTPLKCIFHVKRNTVFDFSKEKVYDTEQNLIIKHITILQITV